MKKKVANIVMVAVFAFTVIYLMISSDLKTKWEFKKNGILLNGKIVDISMSSKSSSFKCEFYYKGIKMSRTSGDGIQRSTYFIG